MSHFMTGERNYYVVDHHYELVIIKWKIFIFFRVAEMGLNDWVLFH